MIRKLLVAMSLFMGYVWSPAQEVKIENFSMNVGENHIDSLATVVAKTDSLVLHAGSLVSYHDLKVQKKDSLILKSDSLAMKLDPSLLMHMDSLGIFADSLQIQPDTLIVPVDSVRRQKNTPEFFLCHLSSIKTSKGLCRRLPDALSSFPLCLSLNN